MPVRLRLAGAILAAVATTVTACGGPAAPSTESISAPGPAALSAATAPVSVTLWHGMGGAAGEALQAEIDAFNAANRGKIEAP